MHCSGHVNPPTNGTKLTFCPGMTAKIDWSYDNTSRARIRSWFFKSSDGLRKGELIKIDDNDLITIMNTLIPMFQIQQPATLILLNVSETYNGTYIFTLEPGTYTSEVTVHIAGKISGS